MEADKVLSVVFILDNSGSMIEMKDEPRQGLNAFYKTQQEAGDFLSTLIFFNSRFLKYDLPQAGKPIIIIKTFSLMIRLYANIFAGHILLMSIIGLMFIFKSWIGSTLSFGLSFVLSILEILVAFLQAYIFTMLSALYFGSANEEHHHEEAHHL